MSLTSEQLLDRYHAAMVAGDADALADLYAPDGVHEFPFFNPQGVKRLHGPDQIRGFYRPLWADSPASLDRIETVSLHHTETDGMIINELVSIGHRRSDGMPFRLAGLLILTTRDGSIINNHDYMDLAGLHSQLA
jgi:ketosteroid isomerase-like protein